MHVYSLLTYFCGFLFWPSILKHTQVNNFFRGPILPWFSSLTQFIINKYQGMYSFYVISNLSNTLYSLTWEKQYEAWNEDLKMHHGVDLEAQRRYPNWLWHSAHGIWLCPNSRKAFTFDTWWCESCGPVKSTFKGFSQGVVSSQWWRAVCPNTLFIPNPSPHITINSSLGTNKAANREKTCYLKTPPK